MQATLNDIVGDNDGICINCGTAGDTNELHYLGLCDSCGEYAVMPWSDASRLLAVLERWESENGLD